MEKFTITNEYDGMTVREFFLKEKYSVSHVKRLKFHGEISVNGERVTVRYKLKKGDVLSLQLFDRLKTPVFAEEKATVLYEDEYLYVAYKPYGIPTHPDRKYRDGTLGNMLASYFGKDFCLRIITRLDKTTSGLVLGALNEVAADKLNMLQTRHKIFKTYIAETEGVVSDDVGEINLPLMRADGESRTLVDGKGKSATTRYEVVQRKENSTVVRLYPLTGRTHQLRAHLSAIGHPIVGDVLYGASPAERVRLHCERLMFTHPYTGEKVDVEKTELF